MIAAVGDIAFEGRNAQDPNPSVFMAVQSVFESADIVIANLENPLIKQTSPVSGKCTLHGTIGWAQVLKESGIDIVSLANNHMMDHGVTGLQSTISALRDHGIAFVGAGMNQVEAESPVVIDAGGHRIGILGRSNVEVTSRCYANRDTPGVAFLNEAKTFSAIQELKKETDYVILIVHWGLEEYEYPTPYQRRLATHFIASGASAVIGHHPHVLQGYEYIGNGLVAYSLGNFLFDEFDWAMDPENQTGNILHSKLSELNRQGLVFKFLLSRNSVDIQQPVFTRINGAAQIELDHAPNRLVHFNRLSARLNYLFFWVYWKVYSLYREFKLRIGKKLSPVKLIRDFRKIRLRHFKQLFLQLYRSAKIVSGKSTNPYD